MSGLPIAKNGYAPLLYGSRHLVWEMPNAQVRLEKIEPITQEINEPSSPQQIRRWYLQMPGPKVELNPRRYAPGKWAIRQDQK